VLCLVATAYAQSSLYCMAVGPTSTADTELGPVKLIGETMAIDDQTGCPGDAGVQDFTQIQKANLKLGKNYTLYFEVTYCGSPFTFQAGAWIDFNLDYQWTPDERIMTHNNTYTTGSIEFQVPIDPAVVKTGISRMRVQVQENARLPYDPCAMFVYGATKDFTIQLISGGGGGASDEVSGGGVFLILLTVVSVMYVAIGCGYKDIVRIPLD